MSNKSIITSVSESVLQIITEVKLDSKNKYEMIALVNFINLPRIMDALA